MSLLLTQSSNFIIGPIAQLFGYIMNGIFILLRNFGIVNIGICIIIFTIIVNLLMLPITYKQQKFSRLTALMNPEIQAVQKKYQGKRDNVSMQKMNDETTAIYEKYGTSPTGSCLPLAIQLPIIWGLYNVVLNIPAYVSSVKDLFLPLANQIVGVSGYQDTITQFVKDSGITRVATDFATNDSAINSIVDILYRCTTNGWENLRAVFPTMTDAISGLESTVSSVNNFVGLNIADSPLDIIKSSFEAGNWIIVIVAILIPVLAALTQFINAKLMPQSGNDNSTMANSMKTMNYVMPLISFVMCFTFATGIGLYWIANSAVRGVIQFIANKKLEKIDFDKYIEENKAKAEKKRERRGTSAAQMNENARINTRGIKMESSNEVSNNSAAAPGSLREKANMVKSFNEKKNN